MEIAFDKDREQMEARLTNVVVHPTDLQVEYETPEPMPKKTQRAMAAGGSDGSRE